MESNPIASKDS